MRFTHSFEQELLAGGIQFGKHVIEKQQGRLPTPVSYTHLTLPTIYSV